MRNNDATHDIAGYVSDKLSLVNMLLNTKYEKLLDAKLNCPKEMSGIIDKLNHKELIFLINKIEDKL